MNLAGQRAIARASKTTPVSLVAFDLLWLDGHDTTGLPLEQRRELLELVVGAGPPAAGHGTRRRRRERARDAGARAGARRGDGEAPRLAVRAGASQPRLAQDQADEHPGLRGPGLDTRQGRPCGLVRRAARRRDRRRRPALGRSGRLGLHRSHARRPDGASSSRSCDPTRAIDDPAPRRREGRDVRGARARLRGPIPRDDEEHAEDARAVVPGHAPRRAARGLRPGAAPAGSRRAPLRRPEPGRARSSRWPDRCPRPRSARPSRCSRRPRRRPRWPPTLR